MVWLAHAIADLTYVWGVGFVTDAADLARARSIEARDELLAAQEREANLRSMQRVQQEAHRRLQADFAASQATIQQLQNRVFELECDLQNHDQRAELPDVADESVASTLEGRRPHN